MRPVRVTQNLGQLKARAGHRRRRIIPSERFVPGDHPEVAGLRLNTDRTAEHSGSH
jgi:hypothetical protein